MVIRKIRGCVVHALQMNGDYGQGGGTNFWPVFPGSGDGL